MAQSVLMAYENIDNLSDKKDYWKKYVEFYERYWDGPATPQSSWWGREYNEFKESLSSHIGIDNKHIKDCFFIKDENKNYFVCPIGSEINLNIYSCENFIPFEWFLLFDEKEKNYFYTHTGYGAIHHDAIYYKTSLEKGVSELKKAEKILHKVLNTLGEDINKYPELSNLNYVKDGISNLNDWLSGFSSSGIVILNYGEICSFIVQDSMKNENSVGELKSILKDLEKNGILNAESNLRLLNAKWFDISSKASGDVNNFPVQ